MTAEELLSAFGTATPTGSQIESQIDSLWDLVGDRWTGRYTVAYRDDGAPELFFFIGVSGD